MPTCSQAKIITNLESDIHKRLFELSNLNINNNTDTNINRNDIMNSRSNSGESSSSLNNYQIYENENLKNSDENLINNQEMNPSTSKVMNNMNCNKFYQTLKSKPLIRQQTDIINTTSTLNSNAFSGYNSYNSGGYGTGILKRSQFYYPSSNLLDIKKKAIYELVKNPNTLNQNEQQHFSCATLKRFNNLKQTNNFNTRRLSIHDLQSESSNYCEIPPINNNKMPNLYANNVRNCDGVPINFLLNSSFRTNSKYLVNANQGKISSIYNSKKKNSKFNNKIERSDGSEEDDDDRDAISDGMNSEKSNLSLPEIDNKVMKNSEGNNKKSTNFSEFINGGSKRNSFDSCGSNDKSETGIKKFNSMSNNNLSSYFSNFPKLALEVEAIEQYSNKLATNKKISFKTNEILNDNIEYNNNANNSIEQQKRFSVNQAKRLLALASIRPSKTFHKSMTDEEIMILKKYYDEIKPKQSISSQNSSSIQNADLERVKYESMPPIIYNTAKVDFLSLKSLKSFIDTHRKAIENGEACYIDYDITQEPKCFILKNQNNETIVKMPIDLNDTFLALALVNASVDKESQLLNEANLFRIINWNDTTVINSINTNIKNSEFKPNNKKIKKSLSPLSSSSSKNIHGKKRSLSNASSHNQIKKSLSFKQQGIDINIMEEEYNIVEDRDILDSNPEMNDDFGTIKKISNRQIPSTSYNNILSSSSSQLIANSAPSSSGSSDTTFSFEYIKNLSSLVNSIIEPKLLKQLTYTGVDISVLPGGKNFDMPSFEELGIDINRILSSGKDTSNTSSNETQTQIQITIQNPKLKSSAYKKLKDKINSSKVMWFSAPPERKPLSVIFEYCTNNEKINELNGNTNNDIDHETILNETNKYLKEVGDGNGHVVSLEMIPRSVHFGSVYVQDLWILTLSSKNTKFHTIANGIRIKDEYVIVKSYDEFIFAEYERFIRNEKYKKIIKNHEKAVELSNKANKAKFYQTT